MLHCVFSLFFNELLLHSTVWVPLMNQILFCRFFGPLSSFTLCQKDWTSTDCNWWHLYAWLQCLRAREGVNAQDSVWGIARLLVTSVMLPEAEASCGQQSEAPSSYVAHVMEALAVCSHFTRKTVALLHNVRFSWLLMFRRLWAALCVWKHFVTSCRHVFCIYLFSCRVSAGLSCQPWSSLSCDRHVGFSLRQSLQHHGFMPSFSHRFYIGKPRRHWDCIYVNFTTFHTMHCTPTRHSWHSSRHKTCLYNVNLCNI